MVFSMRFVLLAMGFLVISCMPSIQDEELIAKPEILTHSVDSVGGSNFDINLTGSCPVAASRIYVSVNNDSYSEALSLGAVAGSGNPVGSCSAGTLSIIYPVPNPSLGREITFKVRVGDVEGKRGSILTYTINYQPTSQGQPGFGIVSVGGVISNVSGNNMVLYTAGGEVVRPDNHLTDGFVVTGSGMVIRNGLAGIHLEP